MCLKMVHIRRPLLVRGQQAVRTLRGGETSISSLTGVIYILPFWPGRPGCCKPPPVTTRKSHKIPTRQKLRLDGQESPQDGSKTAKMPKRTPTGPQNDPK